MLTFTDDPAHPIVPVRAESPRPSPTPPTSHLNIQPHDEPQTSGSAPGLSPPSCTTSPALTSAQSYTTVTSSSSALIHPRSPTPPGVLVLELNHPTNLSSPNADPSRPHTPSRGRRVSLPDDTERSIVTIGESLAQIPLVSPLKPKPAAARSESPSRGYTPEAKGDKTQTNSVAGGLFGVGESVNDGITNNEIWLSEGEFEKDEPSPQSVEDFRMPPNFHHSVPPSIYSLSIVPDVRSEYTVYAASPEVNLTPSTAPSQFFNPLNKFQPQPHHKRKQSLDSTTSLRPQFLQPTFLASDFPMTTVQVSHSSIHFNDRGKEVLSLVITVDPGSGKESWRIEKVYSDFIWLDQRIRSANRHLAKWMPSLPDSKLLHDHAPTKVR